MTTSTAPLARRARFAVGAALTLCLGLAACGGSSADDGSDAAADSKDITMMVDVAFLPKHAPFFSAKERGFFKAEGINLKIVPGSGSTNTVVAVDTGKVDFGWADYAVTVLNVAKGLKVKQVALVQGADAYAVVTTEKSGIKKWADLKGKTVATEGAGAMTAMWPAAMEKAGFGADDVKVVHSAGEAKIPGLLASRWDANLSLFVSDEPVLVGLGEKPVVLKWSEVGISQYGNGVVASDKTIADDPELVKAFTRAVTKGFLWACANQEQAADDLVKNVSDFKKEAILVALEGQCSLSWTPENEKQGYGTMSDEGVQRIIDVAGKYLGLADPSAVKPSDVFTNDMVEPITKDTKIELPKAAS